LKPDDSCRRRRSPEESASRRSKGHEALHCENDRTKSFRSLTTGMFNLIVKDPYGLPPERAALDRSRNGFSATCASSNLLRCIFARTFRDYRKLEPSVKRRLPRRTQFDNPCGSRQFRCPEPADRSAKTLKDRPR